MSIAQTGLELSQDRTKVVSYRGGEATVSIPDSVTSLPEGLFAQCTALQSVKLPLALKELPARLFAGCKSLERVRMPSLVHTVGNACFAFCTSLKSAPMCPGITEIQSDMFKGCTGLDTFALSDEVEAIRSGAFAGCTALETVIFSASVEVIEDGAFDGCTSLRRFRISDDNLAFYVEEDGTLRRKSDGEIVLAPVGAFGAQTAKAALLHSEGEIDLTPEGLEEDSVESLEAMNNNFVGDEDIEEEDTENALVEGQGEKEQETQGTEIAEQETQEAEGAEQGAPTESVSGEQAAEVVNNEATPSVAGEPYIIEESAQAEAETVAEEASDAGSEAATEPVIAGAAQEEMMGETSESVAEADEMQEAAEGNTPPVTPMVGGTQDKEGQSATSTVTPVETVADNVMEDVSPQAVAEERTEGVEEVGEQGAEQRVEEVKMGDNEGMVQTMAEQTDVIEGVDTLLDSGGTENAETAQEMSESGGVDNMANIEDILSQNILNRSTAAEEEAQEQSEADAQAGGDELNRIALESDILTQNLTSGAKVAAVGGEELNRITLEDDILKQNISKREEVDPPVVADTNELNRIVFENDILSQNTRGGREAGAGMEELILLSKESEILRDNTKVANHITLTPTEAAAKIEGEEVEETISAAEIAASVEKEPQGMASNAASDVDSILERIKGISQKYECVEVDSSSSLCLFAFAEKLAATADGEGKFSPALMSCCKRLSVKHSLGKIHLFYGLPFDHGEFMQMFRQFILGKDAVYACDANTTKELSPLARAFASSANVVLDKESMAEQLSRAQEKGGRSFRVILRDSL